MRTNSNSISWVNGGSFPPVFPWSTAGHSIPIPAHANSSQFGVLGNRVQSQFPPILFLIFSPGQWRVIRFSSLPLVNGGSSPGQRRVISTCLPDRFLLLSPAFLTLLPFFPGQRNGSTGQANETPEPAQEPDEKTPETRPIPAHDRLFPALPLMHKNPDQFHYSRQFCPKKPGTPEFAPIEPKNTRITTIYANSQILGKIERNSINFQTVRRVFDSGLQNH